MRDDLQKHAPNSLVLFVSEMILAVDDIDSFASESITDHGNDKKCDLVYISREDGKIVVAQNYESQNLSKGISEQKTTDLNTAVSWLLTGDELTLPDALKGAALEARSALLDGDINEFHIWSVHNLKESQNLERELQQTRVVAKSILDQYFKAADVDVFARQIGIESIEDVYRRGKAPILVSDTFTFETKGGFEVAGPTWNTYCTAVRADALRTIWADHKSALLSPNIREYLGSRKSTQNINHNIKLTAQGNPKDFLIFNNGITALVNKYRASADKNKTTIEIEGIGIVNGGQTTGSLGELTDEEAVDLHDAWVQVRFVSSADPNIVNSVVKFNNTQNKVQATDFRSGDAVQQRLRTEFESIPDAEYRGGRRGGSTDAMRREKNLLADGSVAQSLAAFHGEPNLGYNETRQIWEDDAVYARFFNESLTAKHVLFCHSLLKAVEQVKQEITALPETDRTAQQKTHAAFLSSRGAIVLTVAAVASCVEVILSEVVTSSFDIEFKKNTLKPEQGVKLWLPVVRTALSFSEQLKPATNQGLKSSANVRGILALFTSLMEATVSSNKGIYDEFAKNVKTKKS